MSKREGQVEAGAVPRLRADLDFVPVSYQGRDSLLVRDPLELIPQPILIQGDALELLLLIDGRRSLRDLQVELMRRRERALVPLGDVARLVGELEEAWILDSAQLLKERGRLSAEYAALAVRPPSHAGLAYPSDRKTLEGLIDRILDLGGAPGSPAGSDRPLALIAPHIDLEAGQRTYARAYGPLRGALPPDRVLLLGTGHSLGPHYFSLTGKDFETPLGTVRTDRGAVARLREKCGKLAAPDDFGHCREHSLEFQLIFLQRCFGPDFAIVPVLCGSFQEALPEVGRASEIPGVGDVLESMRELLEEDGGGALVVAGVDLSHVGPKFGHDLSAAALLAETRRHDGLLTDALCRLDAGGFWGEVRQVRDRYNVCGFSSLACLLEVLSGEDLEGRLLDYAVWREEATRSAVSFAAITYHRTDAIMKKEGSS